MVTATSINLDDELKGRAQHLAEPGQRTPHGVMREAIEHYVELEERHETLKRDTLKAWDNFQATGLHVTAGEADRWLASWGTERELPPPECHK